MKTCKFFLFFILGVFITGSVFSQDTSRGGIIYGDKWAYMVTAPDGWIMDSNTWANRGVFGLFYEEGKKLGSQYNTPIIYIVQFPLSDANDNELSNFAETDIENYVKNGAKIQKLDKFINENNTHYIYNVNFKNRQYECFVYTRYDKLGLLIIINANNEKQRDELFPVMAEIINSIKIFDKE